MPIRFDRKPGLVVYLTAGDPSLDATRAIALAAIDAGAAVIELGVPFSDPLADRSEEHTSELQSLRHLVCRLLLEKKKNTKTLAPQERRTHAHRAQFAVALTI